MVHTAITTRRSFEEANRAVVAALVEVKGVAKTHSPTEIKFTMGSAHGTAVLSQAPGPDSSSALSITTSFGHTAAAMIVAILLFPIGVVIAIIWYYAANVAGNHDRLIAAIEKELGEDSKSEA